MTTRKQLGSRILTEEQAVVVRDRLISYDEARSNAVGEARLARLCNQPALRM